MYYLLQNKCKECPLSRVRGLIAALVILTQPGFLQAQHTIHGTIYDKQSGEHLVAATVYDTISDRGTVTNEYGFFSITSAKASIDISCSYVGYLTEIFTLEASDSALSLYLTPNLEIGEVTISAQSEDRAFRSSQMSSHSISSMETQKMPLLFGETDLIKALQYLPGISSGMEGTSGIFVRGGGSDQNLILLDGVPVYNVNHLFGLFSVFNGDAINSATIYKGGFPARYSGRLSSVLDIRMKEGNMKEFHGSASIGLISSKLMLEGPIIKDRTSFLVSGRRTYADILSYPVQYLINKQNMQSTNNYIGYFFHDFNAKINHRFSDRNRLYLSAYMGKDEFYMKDSYLVQDPSTQQTSEVKSKEGFNWGNFTSAMRWNYIWSNRLFSNTTISYSTYKHSDFEELPLYYSFGGQGATSQLRSNEYYSKVRDLSGHMDFTYETSNMHQIRFGVKGTRYRFEPGTTLNEINMGEQGSWQSQNGADTIGATQLTTYVEDDFSLGSRFKTNLGLSSTLFMVEGKNYYSFEPRISARYLLSDRWVIKASYAHMSQYLHLLTNSLVGLPTDSWVPTTSRIPPEKSWQLATGLSFKPRTGLSFSVEGFYKEMQNLVEYAEGEEMQMHDNEWESKVLTGEGIVYGLEFFAEKTSGRFTGSFAYTLSKNTRSFDEINEGEAFPYKYDRRHDLSIVTNFQIKDHISLGAVWVFASGINITTLDQSYYNPLMLADPNLPQHGYYDNDIIRNFETRNGYKLPAYHRLDVGLNFDKKKKRFDRTISFGAYNIYARKNAFYLYGEQWDFNNTGVEEKRVMQVTLLPLIPYIKYSIRF